jgi:hypothetical protein
MYTRQTSQLLMLMWAAMPLCCFAQTPAGWHTYRNTDYGFAISYPHTFTLTHTSFDGADAGKDTSNDLDHPGYGCQPTSLACLEYNKTTFDRAGIFGIGVTVNALTENTTRADCYQIDEGDHLEKLAKTVRINGIAFHSGDASEGWTGHSVGMTKYRVFRRNLCWEIEVTEGMYDFAREEDDYNAPDTRTLHRVRRDQESIIHTFTFTDSRESSGSPGPLCAPTPPATAATDRKRYNPRNEQAEK